MATLQIRIDENIKKDADSMFSSLGLDTSTAVRIFLNAALEYGGIPFPINHRKNESLRAIEDARFGKNLNGPYFMAEDAVKAMLED